MVFNRTESGPSTSAAIRGAMREVYKRFQSMGYNLGVIFYNDGFTKQWANAGIEQVVETTIDSFTNNLLVRISPVELDGSCVVCSKITYSANPLPKRNAKLFRIREDTNHDDLVDFLFDVMEPELESDSR